MGWAPLVTSEPQATPNPLSPPGGVPVLPLLCLGGGPLGEGCIPDATVHSDSVGRHLGSPEEARERFGPSRPSWPGVSGDLLQNAALLLSRQLCGFHEVISVFPAD